MERGILLGVFIQDGHGQREQVTLSIELADSRRIDVQVATSMAVAMAQVLNTNNGTALLIGENLRLERRCQDLQTKLDDTESALTDAVVKLNGGQS